MENILEQWKPVLGYEGLYEVSNQGRVKSLRSGKLMRQSIANTGYMQLNLSNRCGPKLKHVHRLVLEAFIGPCPEKMEGCHANGNRQDNKLSNLRWDTRKGNMADASKHGTTNRGIRCSHCRLTEQQVFEIREAVGTQQAIANKYGISREHVRDIKNKKRWSWL